MTLAGGVCVIAAGKAIALALTGFTLSWTHSVERTRWEEDWQVTGAGLRLVEARVQSSGAGMEPPRSAVLENGWWVYRPDLAPQRELVLASSGTTGGGWLICGAGSCREFGAEPGDPLVLRSGRCPATGP